MVRYCMVQRTPFITAFEAERHHEAILYEVLLKVKETGVTLLSEQPELGWASKAHSPNGEYQPCKEFTNGAQPRWIWRSL